MSSILKALKKLEHDKALRRPDSFRIDAEILRGGTQRRRYFSMGASLAAVALFLCGVGGTYVYMKHDKAPVPVLQSQTSRYEVRRGSSSGPPQFPVTTRPAAQPQFRPSQKDISAPEKSGSSPRPMEKQPAPGVKSAGSVPQAVLPESRPVYPSPVPPIAPLATPDKPLLKVNGIAFQDGAESVAVINGITASKGSVIEGARVEEILKDRVRFSRGGEKFDIILDKSD